MPFVRGASANPLLQDGSVTRTHRPVGRRRRHPEVGIARANASEDQTAIRAPRHDRSFGHRLVAPIQTQSRLSSRPVGAMALEARVREDGAHIAIVGWNGHRPRPWPGKGDPSESSPPPRHRRCSQNRGKLGLALEYHAESLHPNSFPHAGSRHGRSHQPYLSGPHGFRSSSCFTKRASRLGKSPFMTTPGPTHDHAPIRQPGSSTAFTPVRE